MEQFAWILWIVLGVALIIAEIFTFGFVLFWFGIGALAAALAAKLGFGFGLQFLIFAAVSIVLTAMSRTLFAKYFRQGDEYSVKTGVDSLPGQVGTVTISSKGTLNEGAVKVFGSTWTAYPVEGEAPLFEGEKVEVVQVKGSSIYVSKVSENKELPEWRK
ncbi:MAG: NfeD family protein [Pyrinomonadaceae bacterium]